MRIFDRTLFALSQVEKKSPAGKAFVQPMWERWRDDVYAPVANSSFFHMRLRRFLIVIGWLFIFIGIMPQVRVLMGLGIAVLVFLHLQNRKCWWNSGFVAVSTERYPHEVCAGEPVVIELVLSNFGKYVVPSVIVQLCFSGDSREYDFQLVHGLKPRHHQLLKFKFQADKGWGDYKIGPIVMTVRDELGLYLKTVEEDFSDWIKVVPGQRESIAKVRVTRSSLAMHSGNFELSVPGRSVSFLGLRPWVDGDTISSIDWRRSLRVGELVVKDFENFSATDATIIYDNIATGHSEFGAISSYREMQELVVALLERLTMQQIRTQVITQGMHLDFGKGPIFFEEVGQIIMDSPSEPQGDYVDVLKNATLSIPPTSLLFLVFCNARVNIGNLLEPLLYLCDRQVDPVLIVFDSAAYGRKISKLAGIQTSDRYGFLTQELRSVSQQGADIRRIINRVAERTYTIAPGQRLVDQYDHSLGV